MKVVFLETVEGSGTMGEVRTVRPGYARNYLLPRGLAAPATPDVLARAERLREIEEERQRAQDEHAQELVGKLEGTPLVMAVRVGEQGRLYGSVTSADVAEKAGEILGEELDRRRILLPEVIRSVGLYTVPIRLSRNVVPEVQVVVVDAEAPEGVEAAVDLLLNPPLAVEYVAAILPGKAETPDVAEVEASAEDLVTAGASESGYSAPDAEAPAAATEEDTSTT
ncbi:MAG: 50S ribosomal protein L9 [Chloroflexi bacterium]|nr:50S ribosomal protein L9 [Chloroflexota bacterium]MDA1146939.1 50S ribosomal protein L9 [Chloroflexota bacterium]MQC82364.1 50S ribosomal protein L9 [Chloroflexota bacterium]MQC82994.1 50S ribosomal protein L9 [Chloroflexota bacterium]